MKEKIGHFAFFASLSGQVVESITRNWPTQKYKSGEPIIRQGQKGERAYLLVDGKVAINVESKDGATSHVSFQSAPDIFGIIEVGYERPYLANVVAIEPCSALVIDRKNYLKMLHSNHQLCINLTQFLSELLYETGRDREVRLFGKVENLLANTLCYFAELYGEEHEYGVLVRRDINKTELAAMLGIARRSVIRGVKTLQDETLIRIEGKQLIIPDLKALRKKAHEAK